MSTNPTTSCIIPVNVLRTAPYSYDWGSGIYAKVLAINIYGESAISESGNGAIIITTPDVPINLAEDYSQRTKSTLGLTWEQAAFNGGAEILDYRINIAEQGQVFSVLADGLTNPNYLAIGLTAGVTYEFKVESRNRYSYSGYSSTLTLLCAFIPEPPLIVTTTNTND